MNMEQTFEALPGALLLLVAFGLVPLLGVAIAFAVEKVRTVAQDDAKGADAAK